MVITVILVVTSTARVACATIDLSSAVVKIQSQSADRSQTLQGSGLLVRFGQAVYVLTSDHVILHDNDGSFHQVSNSDLSAQKCDYLFSDYGKGLALLRLVNPPANTPAVALADLTDATARGGDSILIGAPSGSDDVLVEAGGKWTDSPGSNIFLQVPTMIQVQGSQAEFGMSGGLLTDSQGHALGVLSHQTLADNQQKIRNTIDVIPASTVLPWLREAIANPANPPIQWTQATSEMFWKENPLFDSEDLTFGYLVIDQTQQPILYIALGAVSGTRAASQTPFMAQVRQSLRDPKYEDCLWYVRGFKNASGQFASASSGLFATLRRLSSAEWTPQAVMSCQERASIPGQRR